MGLSQSCDTNNTGIVNFFTGCQTGSSYTLTGNYTITIRNGDVLNINGNVTINGTLTISLSGSSGTLRVLTGNTLTATNLTLGGSATGKNIIVDGPTGRIIVTNTLDFSGRTFDIDTNGSPGGSISAGNIAGGANVTCGSDASCPTFTVSGACAPAGSGICAAGSGLPVQLIHFKSEVQAENINLLWATATEINFDYFNIERASTDLNFISIGQVEGHGTTNERKDYQFTDELPLIGRNYYRLKSVDYDSYTEYFKILAVDFEGEKQFQLSPNPSDGSSISAKVNFAPRENAFVIVYDNVGSIVGKFTVSGSESEFNFSDRLNPGVYFAKFSSDGFTKVSRFLVKE